MRSFEVGVWGGIEGVEVRGLGEGASEERDEGGAGAKSSFGG